MKGIISFLYVACALFCNTGNLLAQFTEQGSKVNVRGLIIDSKTDRPISFANVGYMGKGLGTVRVKKFKHCRP